MPKCWAEYSQSECLSFSYYISVFKMCSSKHRWFADKLILAGLVFILFIVLVDNVGFMQNYALEFSFSIVSLLSFWATEFEYLLFLSFLLKSAFNTVVELVMYAASFTGNLLTIHGQYLYWYCNFICFCSDKN